MKKRTRSAEGRFLSKVAEDSRTGCWIWRGAVSKRNYGRFRDGREGRPQIAYAHRWAYEHWVAPIPDGLEIDHICHNTLCVNPAHLRVATSQENKRNLAGPRATNKSGYLGVSTYGNRYVASYQVDRRTVHVGTFSTAEEASEAARRARRVAFGVPRPDLEGSLF